MKTKQTVICSMLCGIVCAGALFVYAQSLEREASAAHSDALARYGGEQIEVCVATKDIAPGETLNAGNSAAKTWLADLLPEQAVTSAGDVAGKQTTSSILAGEVITMKRFEGTAGDIDVPEGRCAVSTTAKDVQMVGGSIAPGMCVDVYVVGTANTTLLASNVLVLASSGATSSSTGGWVTVALEPASVEEFITATQKGSVYFALPGQRSERN